MISAVGTIKPTVDPYESHMLMKHETKDKKNDKLDTRESSEERETWGTQVDFLLALVGFSVGLGNVWRFPYLCYKNGGGAFLIPYFICVLIGGIPLLFLEISLGQFMAKGGINAWAICPLLQGIGWATTLIIFFVNCYYEVILAWTLYYFFSSFTTALPWESCNNLWNTKHCNYHHPVEHLLPGNKSDLSDISGIVIAGDLNTTRIKPIDPVTEFWENNVLSITDGIEQSGGMKWDLCLCLLLSWVIVFACICKGVKSSGKVVYFTATFPYVLMTILLVRGCTLPGAAQGIYFYLVPDFRKLADIEVWVDAGTQVFFSYAIGIGGLTALGSYNTWNHNSYRDSLLFAACNSGTSLFAGFLIFSVLGYMAHEVGLDVSEIAESGPGLAFVAYPKAVSQMPVAPLWSALFFFMILLLGLDSQFVGVEGLVTALADTFPALRRSWKTKTLFTAVAVFIHFLVGLSMVTRGGMYVFQLFDYYPASRIVVLVGFFECITVSWFYGVNRYYDNIEVMLGFRINPWMKACWLVITPMYCLVIFVLSTVNYSALTYVRPLSVYEYPAWAVSLGWFLAITPIMFIPATAIYKAVQYRLQGKPLHMLLQPHDLQPHQLKKPGREDMSGESLPYMQTSSAV